jgi:hypothetical protein
MRKENKAVRDSIMSIKEEMKEDRKALQDSMEINNI